jgi:hypothetical protein
MVFVSSRLHQHRLKGRVVAEQEPNTVYHSTQLCALLYILGSMTTTTNDDEHPHLLLHRIKARFNLLDELVHNGIELLLRSLVRNKLLYGINLSSVTRMIRGRICV